MSEHAPLPPSGAPVWGHCSGSVIASLGALDKWTTETAEGTAAHWVGASALTADAVQPDCEQYLGQTDPNGTVIDDKMVEGAQVYCDHVAKTLAAQREMSTLHVEHRVYMPKIHPENWGTLDAAIVNRGLCRIYLLDYKHGHRVQSARENLQLIDYVAGLADELDIDGYGDQHWTVYLRIVQPYAYRASGPVDEWIVNLAELRPYFNQLRTQAEAAYLNPTMTPGLYCRDCPARDRCDAAKRWLYAWADYGESPYVIDTMDSRSLAIERGLLQDVQAVLKARLESIEDELRHRISNGAGDTGLVLETTEGRLEWAISDAQVLAIGQQFGVDLAKQALLTPTQAKDKVPKPMRSAFTGLLKSVARRPAGALTLKPAADSRTARAFQPPQPGGNNA